MISLLCGEKGRPANDGWLWGERSHWPPGKDVKGKAGKRPLFLFILGRNKCGNGLLACL